jgi:hypothetical protein
VARRRVQLALKAPTANSAQRSPPRALVGPHRMLLAPRAKLSACLCHLAFGPRSAAQILKLAQPLASIARAQLLMSSMAVPSQSWCLLVVQR